MASNEQLQTLFQISTCLRASREALQGLPFPPFGWIAQAGLTFTLVQLKDALQLLSLNGQRVSFTDDVADGDVTKLISTMRNAACHVGSADARIKNSATLRYATAGPGCHLATIGDVELKNPYMDDVAFFYGANRLFLKRHLHRAQEEAEHRLAALKDEWGTPFMP